MTDEERAELEASTSNADYDTDRIRAEMRGFAKQLDDLAHRLAHIEDHLRLNGRL